MKNWKPTSEATVGEELLRRRIARTNPLSLAQYFNPKYQAANHLKIINDALMRIEAGEIDRLIIEAPPRHGKSEMISHYYPVWYIGTHPENEIATATYGDTLARTFGRKVRNDVGSQKFKDLFGDVGLVADSHASNRFDTKAGGAYCSTGVKGPLTGRGAHRLIIDDPIKGPEDAESKIIQESIEEWFEAVAETRLAPEGAIIILMTRWNSYDLVGRLLKKLVDEDSKDNWTRISLPAIDDNGKALWPERWPLEKLERKRDKMNPYFWNALYQQRPSAREGNIVKLEWFKRFKSFEDLPKFDMVYQTWDTAFKTKQSNDFSVCLTFGVKFNGGIDNADFYLIHMLRKRLETPQLLDEAVRLGKEYTPKEVIIEDKASGQSMLQFLRQKTKMPVRAFDPGTTDKTLRATYVTPTIEHGHVYIPVRSIASWVKDFEEETSGFPYAPHDDIVDAMVNFISYITRRGARPSFTVLGGDNF